MCLDDHGDWNVDVNEMQQMSFDEEVQDEWLSQWRSDYPDRE